MAKSNPLFVDSTKMRGDRIDTQIELHRVLLMDGEELVVLVQTASGQTERLPMKLDGENYRARIWLGHQESIHYRFAIEKDKTEVCGTASKPGRAQYAIIETWEATFEESEKMFPLRKPVPSKPAFSGGLGGLIEKWGL